MLWQSFFDLLIKKSAKTHNKSNSFCFFRIKHHKISMNLKTLLFLLLPTLFVFSQRKISIVDAENKQAIPYAKILFDKGNYRNTEPDGSITISPEEKITEIQAFGYENLKVDGFKNVFLLVPKTKEIEEIVLIRPKNTKQITVGKIKREFPTYSYCASDHQWTVLNFFEYKNTYFENTFIKIIRFSSKVENIKNNAKINLVFYHNENGKPSTEVWKSIIIECEPGKKVTEIDLRKQNITFPKEGLFIGFEWIINTENSFSEKVQYKYADGKKEMKMITTTNPFIYSQKSETATIFVKSNLHPNQYEFKSNDNKPRSLSIELELTD